ncbi:MAG: CDF family Co(II)/Ni(II) efflux transporter DmeF [Betaproteobacteria bacterium]|nr:CDF family Co(II)/Ni(II) efflux transporter DmeF [Betaproteobacteria bacterium]
MQEHSLAPWQHTHDFAVDHGAAERSTRRVMLLAAAMMAVEIVAGGILGSMALLADGWHMATHVAAFGVAVFAYRYARSHAHDPRFSFGTGKVGVLGGFASAVALAVVSLAMVLESLTRFVQPHAIRYDEAIGVAVLGLTVNLVSGWMLHEGRDDDHGHDEGRHHDHNLRAAYLHVLADALTSVLAIVALCAGKFLGWAWLDPAMGIVGAAIVALWAWNLIRDTAWVLLDASGDDEVGGAIRAALAGEADNLIADLHVWHVGPGRRAASVSVVTHQDRTAGHYRELLGGIPGLAHLIIEVNCCGAEDCAGAPRVD